MTIDEQVLAAFYNIISESKQDMFDWIASERTRYLTVVLETVQKEHNASAVLRTCDCFGIQDLHAIEKNNNYVIQREIARGAGSWVDIFPHSTGDDPTEECLRSLKAKGYKIVGTSPHAEQSIHELDINQPIALVFGTERDGLSSSATQHSDQLVRIPMFGFTESFNISVSAALCLNILRHKLSMSDLNWKLNHEEQVKLKIDWSSKIVKNGHEVEAEIRKRILEKE